VIPAAAVEEHLQHEAKTAPRRRNDPDRRILPLLMLVLLLVVLVLLAVWGLSR
jgi:hypothetical protein